ncbi:hypothetical protein TruAng_008386 [Truncatella angustata]|nr:hypothetical protein TruAng_008386 [Truncatella angustata]
MATTVVRVATTASLFCMLLQGISAHPGHQQSVLDNDNCPTGVHIVGVRGTLEKPGFGALQEIVDDLLKELPGSDSFPIDYPASGIVVDPETNETQYRFAQYSASKNEGYNALALEIKEFANKCPETGIVLMGYSQGAHVVGDSLCGVRPGLFWPHFPIPSEYLESVRAIIQLGDPTNTRNLAWHAGNSTKGGIFPRQTFAQCKHFGDIWRSYCDKDDFFCDRGNSITVHMGYVERYKEDIVDFIVKKVKQAEGRTGRTFHFDTSETDL